MADHYLPRENQFDKVNATCSDQSTTRRGTSLESYTRIDGPCPLPAQPEQNVIVSQSGVVSYVDLASENERLQADLNRAKAELAMFHRWFDGLAHHSLESVT